VTITEVKTSPDLRNAKVFYSVLGNAKQVADAKRALESARGMIRRLIGQRITIRYTPEFNFYYDQTLEKSARIEQALQEIKDESGENKSGHTQA
jgi:ribosome-binding factor A